jgi:hypothetical protein
MLHTDARRRRGMTPGQTPAAIAEGTVSLRRGQEIYTAEWVKAGTRLMVYWGLDEESALLGVFEKEPEALARIVLSELLDRKVDKEGRESPSTRRT